MVVGAVALWSPLTLFALTAVVPVSVPVPTLVRVTTIVIVHVGWWRDGCSRYLHSPSRHDPGNQQESHNGQAMIGNRQGKAQVRE